MGQDQPEALGRVCEILAVGLGGAAHRRFGGRVQTGTKPKQIHRASRSDGAHVVSRRAGDAGAAEGVGRRGNGSIRIPLEFVRFEPYVIPKKSLTGDSTERVDTRVLQVIYRVKDQNASLYVGQQMDVYIKTPDAANPSRQGPDSAAGHGQ